MIQKEKSSPLIRDPWLDNAKAGLIILVVIGHMISTPRLYYPTFEWMYNFINFFHMPAFLVISGYLMKGRVKNRRTDAVINKNLIPYIFAQVFLYVIFVQFDRGLEAATSESLKDGFTFAEPVYQMWFLLALVIYYFICVALKPEKKPVLSMCGSVLLSISLGFFKVMPFLRLTKTLCFLPFFLLGYLMTPERLDALKNKKTLKVFGVIGFALLALFVVLYSEDTTDLVLFFSRRYIDYPIEFAGYYPIIARIIYIPLAMIISLLYLTLIPHRRYFFTKYGERSMYIYVLHAIPVVIFRICNYETEFYTTWLEPAWVKAMYLLFGLMIVVVCASDPVVKVFKKILEPDIDINKITDYFKNKKVSE